MPITIACGCGRSLKVRDELAGRKVRCPGCSDVLTVPAADSAAEAESAPLAVGPPPLPPSRSATWDEPRPSARSRRRRDEDDDDEDEDDEDRERSRRRARMRAREQSSGGALSGGSVNGSIAIGLLMMLGAVIWFFGGLAAGYIFFYPPILFVLGIIAVVKGFIGRT